MRNDVSDFGKWFIADNVMIGSDRVTADNWDGGVQPQGGKANLKYVKLEKPWESMPINQQSAEDAFDLVLANAGATLPKRDAVDTRIINETKGGFTSYEGGTYRKRITLSDTSKKSGIIDTQNDVGGWPELKSLPAPQDTDHDGMPDKWEKSNGLNPADASDRNRMKDGYTMLEKYLNSIR